MLFLGSTMAMGAFTSVMADPETGLVVPQALENRLNAGEYGTGNLIATNTPLPGQMLYAGGAGNSLLFWGEALATGATQIVANIQGQPSVVSTYNPQTHTLTLEDLPAPEATGGDSSTWSTNPAIANPNIGGFDLTNVADVKGVDGESLLQAGAVSIHGVYPITVTNVGESYYVGMLQGAGGLVIVPDFTNVVTITYVNAAEQMYVVPPETTQVFAYVWGAGGGGAFGGAGGFSYAQIPTIGGETLTVQIGQAGTNIIAGSGYAITRTSYPAGGYGVSRATFAAGGGGGRSSIRRGTNYLVVAGGGGGMGASAYLGGPGGGISGANGTQYGGAFGYGGTQTNGGAAGTMPGTLQYTPTSGDWMSGGNGGTVTGVVAGCGGGGGDGWYGGGGGCAGVSTTSRASGGGGSGYINPDYVPFGYSIRGVGTTPAMQEFPYYVSGAGAIENNGLIVLMYE